MKSENYTELEPDELFHLMALTRIPRLGSVGVRKLLQHFGKAQAVFHAPLKELTEISGKLIAENIKMFQDFHLVENEIHLCQREGVEILHWFHPDYPFRLLHIPDSPVILFRKGKAGHANGRMIAVVGTRKMTPYGKGFIARFMKDLKIYAPVIVSGLAYGVDIEAHREAMRNGLVTIAVLGTPVYKVYPGIHQAEAEELLDKGGAIYSETWSSEKMDPNFFLRRNRIVAGMTEATIVVESARKGGALTTAEMAMSYNRDVFAVPGRTTDTYSEGTNHLIKTEKARMLTSVDDLVWHLNWPSPTGDSTKQPVQRNLFPELNEDERKIMAYLAEKGASHPDNMAVEMQWPVSKVSNLLLMMELKGVIQALPGRKYELIG